MYMDGIPINTSDGLVDLFEIDPTAYRYVEVFKGANALRYGANSLGGAVNFVTPTGRDASRFEGRVDAGSFGYLQAQASTGTAVGALDYFIEGRNLLDKRYIANAAIAGNADASSMIFNPGTGRSVYGGMKLSCRHW